MHQLFQIFYFLADAGQQLEEHVAFFLVTVPFWSVRVTIGPVQHKSSLTQRVICHPVTLQDIRSDFPFFTDDADLLHQIA